MASRRQKRATVSASVGDSMPTPVEPTRVHQLTPHPIPDNVSSRANSNRASTGAALEQPFVLYWMLNSLREKQSPALEFAAGVASRLRIPLRAAHTFDVVAQDNRPLPERHAYFLLETLADVQTTLRDKRNVTLAVIAPGTPPEISVLALGRHAVAIVTDTCYLRKGVNDRLRVASALEKAKMEIPFIAVEGDVIAPVEEVSAKVEHAARTIRPKVTKLVPKYLNCLDPVMLSNEIQPSLDSAVLSPHGTRAWVRSAGLETLDVRDIDAAVASLPGLDRGAPRVPQAIFRGGEREAQKVLATFLEKRLEKYSSGRNEPALGLQSDLSPYLRVGAISPVDVVMKTQAYAKEHATKGVKEGVDSFLEELIVRRELSVNMCWFGRDDYDVYDRTVPAYAKVSLALHKIDKRPVVYSYEELEAAVTYDEMWNAAQLELIVTGKMHGYMRMYWAKQIIGWVSDPETALDYCIRLNNRWELDAVDPNSYAGVVWNFGRHDQGWKERPIWGKVRYMNDAGLKRKFNMASYVSKVELLVRKFGLPTQIAQIRQSKKRNLVQATLDDSKPTGRPARKRSNASK